jgi:hypothetical protein
MAAFSWSSILKEQDLIIMSVPKDLLMLLQDKIIKTPFEIQTLPILPYHIFSRS